MSVGNIIWIWGLSGSGKTTLGYRLAQELGYIFIDSDSVRRELEIPKDFSVSGRLSYQEALRHHVHGLSLRGINVVVASITPLQIMRNENKTLFKKYIEVYLSIDMNVLVQRDPKGLYKKALAGEIIDFTGVSSPFQGPAYYTNMGHWPDLILDTGQLTLDESYGLLLDAIVKRSETK